MHRKPRFFHSVSLFYARFFLMGAILYPILEICYRGRTHLSMSLLGGLCCVVLVWISRTVPRASLLLQAFLGCLLITQLEFIFGGILNGLWKLNVWDYSDENSHLLGQICPRFSFFWFILSGVFLFLLRRFPTARTNA